MGEPAGAYREVADVITATLEPEGIRVSAISKPARLGKTDLIVTIGAKATQAIAAHNLSTPVLSTSFHASPSSGWQIQTPRPSPRSCSTNHRRANCVSYAARCLEPGKSG
ncbi:MAG TPA: hypothetical protein VFH21_01265 [Burkholderiales bacterium]|nr:hypothetical protein [Burkholderiales bacterium]